MLRRCMLRGRGGGFSARQLCPSECCHPKTSRHVSPGRNGAIAQNCTLPFFRQTRKLTYLHVRIFHNTIQVIQYLNIRRRFRMKPRQRIRRKDDLIIVLNEEVQHVRNKDDKRFGRTLVKCPWDLRFRRGCSWSRRGR